MKNELEVLLDIINTNFKRFATYSYYKNNPDIVNKDIEKDSNKIKCGRLEYNITTEDNIKEISIYYINDNIKQSSYFNKIFIDNPSINSIILNRCKFIIDNRVTDDFVINKSYSLFVEELIFDDRTTLNDIIQEDGMLINTFKDILLIEKDLRQQEYNGKKENIL